MARISPRRARHQAGRRYQGQGIQYEAKPMFNCCSHGTLLHFSLQSSRLNICYYHAGSLPTLPTLTPTARRPDGPRKAPTLEIQRNQNALFNVLLPTTTTESELQCLKIVTGAFCLERTKKRQRSQKIENNVDFNQSRVL